MVTSEKLRTQANTWGATGIEPQTELLRTAADELDAALGRVGELEGEVEHQMNCTRIVIGRAKADEDAIIDACGFEYDDDPDAPRTLVEYVREAQGMAVDHAEHVTAEHADAAVRRLSISSRHTRAQLERASDESKSTRKLVLELQAKLAATESKEGGE